MMIIYMVYKNYRRPAPRPRRIAPVPPPVVVAEVPVKTEQAEAPDDPVPTIYNDEKKEEHPAFPEVEGNDTEAEFARAYTYENLQDSLLYSGTEAREAVRSRAAFSRLGQRNDPKVWQDTMNSIKSEIIASGQSLESFMENSWMPVPEQMAAFWKETASAVPEPSGPVVQQLPRHAQAEAADLVRDSTQDIPAKVSSRRLQEIIDARKRAKTLGIPIPELTTQQKNAVQRLLQDENLSALARNLESL
jgi:hypothetical protein